MKDNYVGDIGDFAKYGLLRALCSPSPYRPNDGPELSLGVVWYLFPDEESNNDGQHLHHYGKPEQYRYYDSQLYDTLEQLIRDNDRCVSAIRQRKVLPPQTVFFEEPLTFRGLPKGTSVAVEQRNVCRKQWLNKAIQSVKGCDLVFVDPDNGLEVNSVKRHQDLGPKYAYFDELLPYVQRNQSLVIYQHKNRSGSVEQQIQARVEELRDKFSYQDKIHTVYFSTSGGRIFFILPSQEHSSAITHRLLSLYARLTESRLANPKLRELFTYRIWDFSPV